MKSIRFGLAATMLCGVAAVGAGIQSTLWQQQVVALTHGQEAITEQILLLRNAMKALDDAETGQRGYLLTGQEAYLEPYDSGLQNLSEALDRLDDGFKNDPAGKAKIAELADVGRAKTAELARTVSLRQSGDLPGAMEVLRTGEGKRLMDTFRARQGALLVEFREARNKLAAAETARFDDISRLSAVVLILIIVLAAGAIAWLTASIRRLDDLQAQREREAMHDALTTLPNRRYLGEWMGMTLAAARRSHQRVAILYFDLDGFKPVNDRFGHEAGDRVLQIVASRLRGALRAHDFVARLGGDEFVAVLPDAAGQPELSLLIARLSRDLSKAPLPELADGDVAASIGSASYPEDGEDIDTLLAAADRAMYAVKEHRKTGRTAVPLDTPAAAD